MAKSSVRLADGRGVGVRRFLCVMLVFGALLSGCASGFDRKDAIGAFEASGASLAEATCIADTLVALDRLDAADARAGIDDQDREAIIRASDRCESSLASDSDLPDDGFRVDSPPAFPEILDPDDPLYDPTVLPSADQTDLDIEAVSAAARIRLTSVGRSDAFARCVVDRLVSLNLGEVLADPAFGMGANAIEADTMASCT